MEIKSCICLLALVVGSTSATKQDTHQTVPEKVDNDISLTAEEDMKVDSERTNLSPLYMDGISRTDNSSTDGGNRREDVDRTNITQQHENGTLLGKSPAVVVTTITEGPTAPNQAEVTNSTSTTVVGTTIATVQTTPEQIKVKNIHDIEVTEGLSPRDPKFINIPKVVKDAANYIGDKVYEVHSATSGIYNNIKDSVDGYINPQTHRTVMKLTDATTSEATTVATTTVTTTSVNPMPENSSEATRPPVPLLRNTNTNSTLLYTAVAGGSLMVICLVVLAVVCRKRRSKLIHDDEAELHNIPNPSGHRGSAHDSENSLYGVTTTTTTQQRNSAHNSENSLYGATIAHPAQRRGSAHESENSLYGAVI